MKLSMLDKSTVRRKKRLGKGMGSGKGKTSGRGTKGQKARGKVSIGFTGAGLPTYKKLPLRRGKGNARISEKSTVVNISDLKVFKSSDIVTVDTLIAKGIITKKQADKGVKLLGKGELLQPLTIKLSMSKKVAALIDKKGGKAENA